MDVGGIRSSLVVNHSGTKGKEYFVTRPRLIGIPLVLRMLFYGTFFLGLVIGGMVWLHYQVDIFFPMVHFEIGGWRWLGVATACVGVVGYTASAYVLSTHGQGAYVEFDPPTALVETGPFAVIRNPVAAFLLLALFGAALALSSTGVMWMFVAGCGLAHLQVIKVEEPLLKKRFGEAYENYCRRVPRWFPRLKRKKEWYHNRTAAQ